MISSTCSIVNPVKQRGIAIQRVGLHQNGAGGFLALVNNKNRNIGKAQTPQIGLNPETGGQAGHLIPVTKIEAYLAVALGFFQPVGADLNLQEEVNGTIKKLAELLAGIHRNALDGRALWA